MRGKKTGTLKTKQNQLSIESTYPIFQYPDPFQPRLYDHRHTFAVNWLYARYKENQESKSYHCVEYVPWTYVFIPFISLLNYDHWTTGRSKQPF